MQASIAAGARPASRSAFSIIYVPLILLLLIAFVAMAVDTGRIRLAKAELQGGADAAARAGISAMPNNSGISQSATRAQNIAQANVVAETNIQFDQGADIEWGIWNSTTHTFLVLVDDPLTVGIDERERANAV